MIIFLLISAIIIVIALSTYAAYLHWKLRKHTETEKIRIERNQKESEARLQRLQEDIYLISRALIAEQVELPEASLRISKLLDYMSMDTQERGLYQVFDHIALSISDIPTHKEWKSLDKTTRNKHQKTLDKLVEEHQENARTAAKVILAARNAKPH